LVFLGYRAAGGRRPKRILPAAAAVELLQAGLLIHDDIMDRDRFRRGLPTLHEQFGELGRAEQVPHASRFGEGMGICAGDVAFFLAFDLFARLEVPPSRRGTVTGMWGRELSRVALAQMNDLYLGAGRAPLSEKEILDLYLHKTARYTFSLPLATGAALAGAGPDSLRRLQACGESMGLLFQLRDDELGLFGNESRLGKPVGSDIRENKKTLYYYHLFQNLPPSDRARFLAYFGSGRLTGEDIGKVRDALEKLGVRDLVAKKMESLRRRALRGIRSLEIAETVRTDLLALLDFIQTRDK
jgi:geranylgeranyl diphosphate synthase type I